MADVVIDRIVDEDETKGINFQLQLRSRNVPTHGLMTTARQQPEAKDAIQAVLREAADKLQAIFRTL